MEWRSAWRSSPDCWPPTAKAADIPLVEQHLQSLLELEVPLIVQIADKVATVGEVTSLQPGVIIEFPKQASQDLAVLVNNTRIGSGQAVKVGENFGIRIRNVEAPAQRIEALGGSA